MPRWFAREFRGGDGLNSLRGGGLSNGGIRWNRAGQSARPTWAKRYGVQTGHRWHLGHNHLIAPPLASKIDAAQSSPRSRSPSILGIPRTPTSLVPLPMPSHLISSHLSSRVSASLPFSFHQSCRHPCSLPSSWRRAPPSHIHPPPRPIPVRAPGLCSSTTPPNTAQHWIVTSLSRL